MPPKSRGRDGGSRSNTAAQTLAGQYQPELCLLACTCGPPCCDVPVLGSEPAEADTLKQRGERRKGLEAVQVLQQAAVRAMPLWRCWTQELHAGYDCRSSHKLVQLEKELCTAYTLG